MAPQAGQPPADCRRRPSAGAGARPLADGRWRALGAAELPAGWAAEEAEPEPPSSEECFAALLHGDRDQWLAYACVLGRRLKETSPGPDRVLLCGPGGSCAEPAAREALRAAGWQRLLPVRLITAEHLDKTSCKRHTLVFTKLRVLELPYARALLLDLDILPRSGADLGELLRLEAPAAKYCCSRYWGPEPAHAARIPEELRQGFHWSPNAGVMRLDPLPRLEDRLAQVDAMVREVQTRDVPTYLPEQYYLAEVFTDWLNLGSSWNWEVWPELDDPGFLVPREQALRRAREGGWSGYYVDGNTPSAQAVLQQVCVWHFSGNGVDETAPWLFQDLPDAEAVGAQAADAFRARDPGGIVAAAVQEWREALEAMLAESTPALAALRRAAARLAKEAADHRGTGWICDICHKRRQIVREVKRFPTSSGNQKKWVCADCVVGRLVAGPRRRRTGRSTVRATF